MTSNLDQAVVAIATTAAEAKKLAAIEPTVNEEGHLLFNGKKLATLIMPSTLSANVAQALGSDETASRLYQEQSEFETQQVNANTRIALENGVYYIEDALPADLKNKVRTRWYETNERPEEALKIVQLIQAFLDKLPSNVYISSRGGVFPTTKNKGYAPDFYGADNRTVSRGVKLNGQPHTITMTLHGGQSCLSLRRFMFNTIDFSKAWFIVEEMGQDVFHLCDGSDGNRIIHGGNIRTRAYLKYGYVRGADLDKMLFRPIDGWTKERPHIGTGLGEKGTSEGGLNSTTYPIVDNACFLNNSLITEHITQFPGFNKDKIFDLIRSESGERHLSAGGYFDENGESAFPQPDGTTSRSWGNWRGCQAGSRGYGWRIFGTKNTRVEYFDVRGFNGGAVVCGLYGTPKGEDIGARDSVKAYENGIVAVNTKISGGYFTHNYICGVEAIRVSGYELCGIYAPDSVVGHPDAHLEHTRGIGGGTSLDPGYQQCTSRYLPMDNLYIHDNVFGLGMRKVMDIHVGNNVKIVNNSGRAMYYGISTVIEEIFAGQLIDHTKPNTSKDTADPNSFYYQDCNIEVRGNVIVSGLFGLHPVNGAKGVKTRKDAGKWFLRCHQVWEGNIVYAPRGMLCNFGHNHFVVKNNMFTFALPFGGFYGLHQISQIRVTNGGSGYTSPPKVVITGGGAEAFDGAGRAKIKDGKVIDIIVERMGSRYTEPPTVTLVGGGGSGATAEAYVNTFTYGMQIGAEGNYGTMLGSNITGNYVQNSPDGNFIRQFVIGNLRGSIFACNFADVTPYSSVEKAKKPFGDPYVSNSLKYRDGIGSFGFYGGALETCEVWGNFIFDQLTDKLEIWTGDNAKGSVHTKYLPTGHQDVLNAVKFKALEMQLAALQEEVANMRLKATTTPSPAQPQPPQNADSGSGQDGAATAQPTTPVAPAPTTPAPVTPANPPANSDQAQSQPAAKPETSIKFTFEGVAATATEVVGSNGTSKLKTENNSIPSGEPDEWAGAFGEVDGHKVMFASARGENKGNRYIESEGISSDGSSDSAIIVPFKATSADLKSGAFGALVLNGRNIVNTGLVMTNGTDGFTLRVVDGTTVDGEPIVANKAYDFNKWHVAVIPVLAGSERAFDKIRFGMNHAGNAGRSITIGAGLEILQGDISKAAEKAAALMAKYSNDAPVTPSPTNPPQSDGGSQGNPPANSGTSQGGASAAQPTTPAPATSAPATSATNSDGATQSQPAANRFANLKRSISFFGDSTNARIGEHAIKVAKADNIPVINNAQGGSLASYALMSMNGSPVNIKFDVDTIPAKGQNVSVDAELVYGDGVTPFSMHSTLVVINDSIEASIAGQNARVKVTPRDATAHSVVVGKEYPVKLKNNGGTDGICVLATGKNDVNGANWGNWQAALERVKGYIQKCIALVQPKDAPRYIVLPIWADNKAGWSKAEHPYRHQLKDELNKWIRTTYGENVYDIEAYMLSEQIWADTGITPNEADKQAQKDGIMPLSLSYDGGAHFLPAVEAVIAGKIIAKAKELHYL
ncbi:hypothetical protein QP713_07815 [Neisseria mucosa]|uniref:Peptidase S74 domain-containing protein n=1 Tax=Neisseria mucosa TaxID=488 RepID=A0AAW6Z7K1_NEIMU|nr:hypothetical protein [Neisseria mucosa]MDK6726617.1 hypothetical protein [Neisseria mucosa]MDK6871051.1 hypothetical protein [Neisseria mucosa]MDK8110693.1 hypothetical protein [Neisseria mucosa]MDK8361921.1 hypothetical protein [Neisseria mucosa]